MSEQTQEITRLDRSKPPPGMWADEAIWNGSGQPPAGGEHYSWGFDFEEGTGFYKTIEAALAAAWAHYQERNDPPWMRSEVVRGVATVWVDGDPSGPLPVWRRRGTTENDARAAAWAWYWRRLALADRLDAVITPNMRAADGDRVADIFGGEFWTRCLAWSDEQVAAVEHWLVEGGELPEVLR